MSKTELIQEYILKRIKDKTYSIGEKIPTEQELMKIFGVSRMTVNKALNVLRDKGYLYSERGRGTFVKRELISKKLNELTSFTEEMKNKGIKTLTKTLEFSYTAMGFEKEKELLEVDKGASLYKLVRIRYFDDLPVALDVAVLNPDVTGHMNFLTMDNSLYEYLEKEIGIVIDYSIQKIKAIKSDEFISEYLKVPLGDPVLKIQSTTYNDRHIPFECVSTYYVHDAYEFEQISIRNNN